MIIKMILEVSTEKLEEVIQELAKEIETGWRIQRLEMLDFTVGVHTRPEPCCRIHLIREEKKT